MHPCPDLIGTGGALLPAGRLQSVRRVAARPLAVVTGGRAGLTAPHVSLAVSVDVPRRAGRGVVQAHPRHAPES